MADLSSSALGDFVRSLITAPVRVITTNPIITLDFAFVGERIFSGISSFTGAKTIVLANTLGLTPAIALCFHFVVTGSGATLTFPANFKSSDARWASPVLTITGAGVYEVSAIYDVVNSVWKLKAEKDGGAV